MASPMLFPVTILPASSVSASHGIANHFHTSRTGSLAHPVVEEAEARLRRTNEQLQHLSMQLQDTPNHLEELLGRHRKHLEASVDSINEMRRENERIVLEIEAKSLRLQELEAIAGSSSKELADNFDPRTVQTRAIAAEAELSSLRKDVRALDLQQTELQLTRESLEKTLARRETESLDETAAGVAQMQVLQSAIHDEELRSEAIQRQVLHKEDCSSMLVTMQSKAVHLSEMISNYNTQTERLMRQYEQLTIDCAEEDLSARAELQQSHADVDAAAASCRRLESELRTQVQSMQVALTHQKDTASKEKSMLKELLHLTQEEITDLLRDVESLMKEKRLLEEENMKIAFSTEHHIVNSDAAHFLKADKMEVAKLTQHRTAPASRAGRSVSWRPHSSAEESVSADSEFIIHTGRHRNSLPNFQGSHADGEVDDESGALTGEWETSYLTRLQVRIGVLEREEHVAAKEKENTAAQLDHFVQHVAEEQRIREKELTILRSEIRAMSFHEEVRIAKTENVQLRAVVHERDQNSALALEDAEIDVSSLTATVQELRDRISEVTNSSLANERAQQQKLFQQQALTSAARQALHVAEEGSKRAASIQAKLDSAELENKRLRECFKAEWGKRDPSPSVRLSTVSSKAPSSLRLSPPKTRPRPLPPAFAQPVLKLGQSTHDDFEEATPLD